MHGTGYRYPPWVGSAWYPFPATYASWGGPAEANRANLYQSYGTGVSSEVRSAFTASPAGAPVLEHQEREALAVRNGRGR